MSVKTRKNFLFIIAIAVLVITFQFSLLAQTGKNDYSIKSWWGPAAPAFSPVVNNDRSITFRIKAPAAAKVELSFDEWHVRKIMMNKDTSGTWSVVLDPVEPGIYCYNFIVDGVPVLDMANTKAKIGQSVYSSIVEVKGDIPRFDEVQDVPHGVLCVHKYKSSSLNKGRNLYVFLPPGYNDNITEKYPVLYLRHGGGDNESNWYYDGCAGTILENLLAQNNAVPMIIVMTDGMTDGSWAGGSTPDGMNLLESELINDVIPLVEKNYRVLSGKDNRAIAGLSMGGGQSFIIGMRNTDKFSRIGQFSSGLLSAVEFNIDEYIPGFFNKPAEKLNLLWIGCGNDDPRYAGHLDFVNRLNEHNIKNEFHESAGGHEWKVWRHQLYGFMQKVFKDNE
jgi:enterochelin esterase-like enzyme